MREVGLYIPEFLGIQITNCIIMKRVNEHGRVLIEGYLDSVEDEEILTAARGSGFLTIIAISSKGKERKLFTGLLESYRVKSSGQFKTVQIIIIGGTKLMDLKTQKRSFQSVSITYEQILHQIKGGYERFHCIMDDEDKSIGRFLVQYLESDWEFVKRLASYVGTGVIPYFQAKGIRFSIGVQKENQQIPLNAENISVEYEVLSKHEQQGTDNSSLIIKTREIYDLGDALLLNDKLYYVYEVYSKMSDSELVHTYKLRTKAGFQSAKISNYQLPGVSLDGSIIAVGGSSVKVKLFIDKEQEKAAARWFPYSTVYSSPDGSGWFCMPEIDDRVRLYFPNETEDDAYVISSIHLPPAPQPSAAASKGAGTNSSVASSSANNKPKEPPRSNPDNKSLMNKFQKQVELTPSGIFITNNNGMSIVIDDEVGIQITSDKDIMIQSEETLSMVSKNESMSLEATEIIELKQGDATIKVEDDITVEGAKVLIQ